MNYQKQYQAIIELKFDTMLKVIEEGGLTVSVFRPSKPPARFKNYDPKRNFQIWLTEQDRSFKPNHLRVMIDLYLRVRSRPDLKAALAQAFDGVFYGEDPTTIASRFTKDDFEHFLNPILVSLVLSQLFLIEQAHGYNGISRYNPVTLFYQGWVRQVLDSNKEIDNLVMSIANRQPPAARYTTEDDKNHKNYRSNAQPLWWLS